MRSLFDLLFPPRADERVVRGITTDEFCAVLAPSLVSATRPSTVALLPFSHPFVRPVLHEAKYHGTDRALELLAAALAEFLTDADLDLPRTRLVPVPLGAKRYRERGYNQAAEIAKRVLGVKVPVDTNLLSRERDTLSQVSLARHEREINLMGAFAATHPLDPSLTYLILDDTITTGATLQAAIDALEQAGAKHILPIALAH